MARTVLLLAVAILAIAAGPAHACSTDAESWFDDLADTSCLQDVNSLELDALGGLRLAANGVATSATWDSDTDFAAPPPASTAPFGLNTLATAGSGTPAALELPTAPLALTRSGSVLQPSAAGGDRFDALETSGVAMATPGTTPAYFGVYGGVRVAGGESRLGKATSSDGNAWTPVDGSQADGSILALDTFDAGGEADPALLAEASNARLYFTGVTTGGVKSVGAASAPIAFGAVGTFVKAGQILTAGPGSFEATGVSHPSVVKDGATYVMYYAGTGAAGATGIGRATADDAVFSTNLVRSATPVLSPGAAGSFDAAGVEDPAVVKMGATWVMAYTGVEAVGSRRIERIGIATSADGITWAKQGIWLNPSQGALAFDETGVRVAGLFADPDARLSVTGVDATGRTRGGVASAANPALGKIPNAWSTYQLGDPTSAVRDFRSITRTSTGPGVTLWLSFLQPSSSTGEELWSDFARVTGAVGSPITEELDLPLALRAVRWQARLSNAADALDKVEISHAPVTFASTGSARTTEIGPPPDLGTARWTTLTVTSRLFAPSGSGTGAAVVGVSDAATGTVLATMPVNPGNDSSSQDLDLSGIDGAAHPKLRLELALTSDGAATPVLESLRVRYGVTPATTPATTSAPTPVLTLAASKPVITFGARVALTGALTRAGTGVPATPVTVTQQPVGMPAARALGTATTAAPGGEYTLATRPVRHATYGASALGVAAAAVTVKVRHRVTLEVARRGRKAIFRGRVGPRHARRTVVVERRAGRRFVRVARVRTSRRSTFRLVKRGLRVGRVYRFRARVARDKQHLAGASKVVKTPRR